MMTGCCQEETNTRYGDMVTCPAGQGKVPVAQWQPTQHSWNLSNNEKYDQAHYQRNVKTYNNRTGHVVLNTSINADLREFHFTLDVSIMFAHDLQPFGSQIEQVGASWRLQLDLISKSVQS